MKLRIVLGSLKRNLEYKLEYKSKCNTDLTVQNHICICFGSMGGREVSRTFSKIVQKFYKYSTKRTCQNTISLYFNELQK